MCPILQLANCSRFVRRRKLRPVNRAPEHDLDYFHATLLPSPDGKWIADNGWAWQPVGIVRAWSIERWLNENVWESEDGPTAKNLCGQDNWDQPMCWINNRTLAAWGEDTTSEEDRGSFSDSSTSNQASGTGFSMCQPGEHSKMVADSLCPKPHGRGSTSGTLRLVKRFWTTRMYPRSSTIAARSSSGDSGQD